MKTRKRECSALLVPALLIAVSSACSGCTGDETRAPAASLTAGTLAPAAGGGKGAGMGKIMAGNGGASSAAAPVRPSVLGGCEVKPVPAAVRQAYKLTDYYQKYADADGIPVVTSQHPVDRTLVLACQLVHEMVGERKDVREALIRNRAHFTIIGVDEQTTDTPEYSKLSDYYDTRARGLGGRVASCAEESILCDRERDRWRGESICVHEFSHTISIYGLYTADPTFEDRLEKAWKSAMRAGLYRDTYATENAQEYWAEGVQSWYDTNLEAVPANGVHNAINTRRELKAYDPTLYALIDELLPEQVRWDDCYRRAEVREGLASR